MVLGYLFSELKSLEFGWFWDKIKDWDLGDYLNVKIIPLQKFAAVHLE